MLQPSSYLPRRICIAPMLAWTDRHCRYFHRLLTKHSWLYTEMVTTGALLHGNTLSHLAFNQEEHPVALQLGGSDPNDLAQCAKLGERSGYDEINLNCGCPSPRVQKGAFGACLMLEPNLVANSVRAMKDAVSIPITIKHRIGIDDCKDYSFLRDFVGHIAQAGCQTFIVHARNAVLKGLNPKENREIPPLNYPYVYQLKKDFPHLEIILNGGIATVSEIDEHLTQIDGVMLGREAYQNPRILLSIDMHFYNRTLPLLSEERIEHLLIQYAEKEIAKGTPLNHIIRPILGWYRSIPGARQWRRILSDTPRLLKNDLSIFTDARKALQEPF